MSDPPDADLNADVTRADAEASRRPDGVGPYRLVQRIGEGGMGEVWLAEQTRPVHRQVALKIIKAGMDTARVVARFEAERQALALMAHPAIAQVFDAGSTPNGRPFFAMEYVRGEPITFYCNRHRLTTRQRIVLFLDVCEGVQHAHQKGIIHRDLKPSNILVTVRDDRAVPKIIDFGVAKATTQPLTDRTLQTEFGALIGTPEYMSPEQAEMTGLDIDTRTDVYALGVVLYELLTGVLPFDVNALREKSLDEIRRTIREVDPSRPSTRVTMDAERAGSQRPTGAAVAGELRGDLDWITMRALEKDRTRRYGSASDLAADLRRHLENLPVTAGPPSASYRAQKFVRRHRLGVTVAMAAVTVLVAFAATMIVQARRIALERDRANREAASARQIADFLVGLFNVSDPSESRGNTLTAREILDKGAQRIDATLSGQPAVQARLLTTIGGVYTGLGLYHEAEPLLKHAIAVAESQLGPDDSGTLEAVNALADLYFFRSRYRDAEPLYVRILASRQRSLGREHRLALKASYDLASTYIGEQRLEEAERLQLETLNAQRRVLGDEDVDTVSSMHNLASLYYRQRRYAESAPLDEKVATLDRRLLGPDHPKTLSTLHNLGTDYAGMRRYEDAERILSEVIASKRRVLGFEHPQTAASEAELARVYRDQRRYAEAEPLLAHACAVESATIGMQARTIDDVVALITLYETTGQVETAAAWRAKLPKGPASQAAAVR